MPNNKNQHYVPKFYFRSFSKDGKTICTLNLDREKFIENSTIRGQCSKPYFYSKNLEIENIFSVLESIAKKKIDKIIENKSLKGLSKEQIHHLKSHLLFQHGRTKYAYDNENEMANYVFDLYKPLLYQKMRGAGEHISMDALRKIKCVVNSRQTLRMSMLSGILLTDLDIVLIENKSKAEFIFSDNPVILFNSYFNNSHLYGIVGFSSRGLQILYPLNPKLLLFCYDPKYYHFPKKKIATSKCKDIQRINGLQILYSDKNVYFKNIEQKERVVELYNRLRSKRPKTKSEHQVVDKKIEKDGTSKELLVTHASKVRYNLEKLSFLQHKKDAPSFGVRNQELRKFNDEVLDAIHKGKIKNITDLELFIEKYI